MDHQLTQQEMQDMINDEMMTDFEPAEWEQCDNPCPDCGSVNIYQMPRMSSPDDYIMQAECRNCGSTWEG